MFGFVSKLVGGVLDKVGLGFLTPVISLGIDFFTGNYAGMIGDVASLVGKFTNLSFLDKVNPNPPLGGFSGSSNSSKGGGLLGKLFNLDFGSLGKAASALGFHKAANCFSAINDYGSNFMLMNNTRNYSARSEYRG